MRGGQALVALPIGLACFALALQVGILGEPGPPSLCLAAD